MRPEHRDHPDRPEGGAGQSEAAERRRIAEALATAAADVDPARVPGAMCRACLELLPVTGVSVSIHGARALPVTWCASDDTAARLAEAQYTLGDGPCRTALDLAAPVLAADLSEGPDTRRWPVFAHQAAGLGVRAVFSLPLGIGRQTIGTLDLYRDTPGALSERDLRIALWVRDAVTFAVLNLQPEYDGDDQEGQGGVASWLEAAEADHAEVHQAVGMVMMQLGLDPQQALDRMRARAFAQGRSVSEVAQDVVVRRLRFRPEGEGHRDADDRGQGGSTDGQDGERS
jgi:hypothetical protein